MQTTAVTPNANTTASTTSTSNTSQVSSQDFLKLLVTQLQNQDPLNPVNENDFASQLAQFSSLEGIQQLNTSFSSLLQLQELTQGASLVGKTVEYQPVGQSGTQTGKVDAAEVQNGTLQLSIGGNLISLDQVRSITAS